MSFLRNFKDLNEECVVCLPNEGDEHIYMPLCGITKCLPGYRIDRNVSRECVLEYVISGTGTYQTSYAKYTPCAGDIYIVHQGGTTAYWTDPVNRWEKLWFNIQGTLIQELLRIYHLDNVDYLPKSAMKDSGALRQVFQSCLEEMKTHPQNAHETATIVTHRLVYHISQQLHLEENKKQNPIALAVLQYLEEHLHTVAKLETISAKFGFSQSQLNRIFYKEYGTSIHRFLLKRKLEYAAIMLLNTRKTIKEIAEELQVTDQYYFSNLFKKHYGVSPRDYRKAPPHK